MSDVALSGAVHGGKGSPSGKPNLDQGSSLITTMIFLALMAGGLFFTAYSLYQDIEAANVPVTTWLPFLLLPKGPS